MKETDDPGAADELQVAFGGADGGQHGGSLSAHANTQPAPVSTSVCDGLDEPKLGWEFHQQAFLLMHGVRFLHLMQVRS